MSEQRDNIENTATQSNEAAPTRQKPKNKLLRRLICGVSAVIFLPVLLIIGALATESGTRLLIQTADKLTDSLTVGNVSGSLQQGLTLDNLDFHISGVDVAVAQARLQLNFACLLQAQICIEQAVVHRPTINIDTALLPAAQPVEKAPQAAMRRIRLPVSVQVKNAGIEQLSLAVNRNQIHLEKLQSALALDNENGLTLSPTRIDGFALVMQKDTEAAQQQAEQDSRTPIDWQQIERTLTPPLLAKVTRIELPFDMHVQDIRGENWQYRYIADGQPVQEVRISDLQLQADATDYLVRLQKFNVRSSLGDVQAEGRILLEQDFPLNLHARADIRELTHDGQILLPPGSVDLSLSGSLKNQTALALQTAGAIDAQLNGRVELNRDKTPLQLSLTAKDAKYPFAATAKDGGGQLHIKRVALNLTGNLLDYQLQLDAQAQGMGVPESKLMLSGKGGLSAAKIERLRLDALDGTLNLQGELDWQDGIRWQTEAELNKINTGTYVKNWPALLSGKLISRGQADTQGWQVEIPDLDLHGSLSQRALSLQGQLASDRETPLDITRLQLNYGENKIVAQGKIGAQSDFRLDINAPDLRGLLPDLSASLNGYADLKGNISEPDVNLEFTGGKIRFQDLRVDKLFAKGRIGVAEQIEGRVDLDLTGFDFGEMKVNHAMLWVTGRETNHQLHFRANGEPVAGEFHFYGNFDRTSQLWEGVLNQVDIKSPLGNLQNDKNINIRYDNKRLQATLSAHCWRSTDVDICFPQAFTAGAEGEVAFNANRINLDLVNKLTERKDLLKGLLRSQGSVVWSAGRPMRLMLQVDGNDLTLAHKIDYRTFKLTVPKLSLNTRLENNNLNLKSEVLLPQGQINSDLSLLDIAKGRKLGGSLNIRNLSLDLVNQLLSNGETVSGEIGAALTFGGDLTAPLLNGSLNINRIRAKMKSLPFDLSDGKADLQFHGNRSTLSAYLQTPDSRLELNGDADWKNLNRWETRVHAKTEGFKLEIPQMAKLRINADVSAQASPELLTLSGDVDIPWARIAVEALPESAVSVSGDEVILEDKINQKLTALPTKVASDTQSGMQIKSDLKIRIGDDVTVSAYGLNSHLQGLLSVRQEKGNLGLYGQIDLKNGRYASFGQDLLIRKGQISFSGLPSQPLLNIEAIRNPEAMEDPNITAGLKVIGLAEQPTVEIFSEPSMPQDQALSYVLTGRSLENSGEAGSGGSVGAALLGLGLGKSGKLVGGIGEAFGIQDLNLGTAGVGDSSKVVVSGNITPRLQIKYGVGLFDGLAEVTLRYKLIPQLYLQSVSGVNQAFDVLYQFDF